VNLLVLHVNAIPSMRFTREGKKIRDCCFEPHWALAFVHAIYTGVSSAIPGSGPGSLVSAKSVAALVSSPSTAISVCLAPVRPRDITTMMFQPSEMTPAGNQAIVNDVRHESSW
jgi:hypothetical protein